MQPISHLLVPKPVIHCSVSSLFLPDSASYTKTSYTMSCHALVAYIYTKATDYYCCNYQRVESFEKKSFVLKKRTNKQTKKSIASVIVALLLQPLAITACCSPLNSPFTSIPASVPRCKNQLRSSSNHTNEQVARKNA